MKTLQHFILMIVLLFSIERMYAQLPANKRSSFNGKNYEEKSRNQINEMTNTVSLKNPFSFPITVKISCSGNNHALAANEEYIFQVNANCKVTTDPRNSGCTFPVEKGKKYYLQYSDNKKCYQVIGF